MGTQAELRRLIRDARDAVGHAARELHAAGVPVPKALDSANENLGRAGDLVRDALADAKAGKAE